MSWTAHMLTLQLVGDIHCGDMPLGFVARTHAFVPGHIPFFALVPAAVKLLGMPDVHASYKAVEHLFDACLRCTPLYVLNDDGNALFPWKDEDREVLESRYLGSRYGVALNDATRSAKDSCLYETEVILGQPRNSQQPTCLQGALFHRPGEAASLAMTEDGSLLWQGKRATLADMLGHMRLGGDRTRALGRPATAKLAPCPPRLWAIYALDCQGQWPALEVAPGKDGPLPLDMDAAPHVQGRPLVLTGRRHTARGAGMGMDAASMAYAPGWKPDKALRVWLSSARCATCAA